MIPGSRQTNLGPSALSGTTVTASSTTHTKGSWTELISSASADAVGFWIEAREVAVTASASDTLLDIGTGAAASEVVLLGNVGIGAAAGAGTSGHYGKIFYFPIAISSGTRISARVQSIVSSHPTLISIHLAQSIQHIGGASAVETLGADTTNSWGASVTPGSSAWGSWTEIGTLSADRNVFMPSLDLHGDTTISTNGTLMLVELGYGAVSSETSMGAIWRVGASTSESISGPLPGAPVFQDLASGTRIVARMASQTETDARSVIVHALECA